MFPIEGDRLVAYDLISGEQLWLVPAAVTSQPAAGDGLIFVAESDAIAALQDRDGAKAWKIPFTDTLASRLVWANGWLVAATSSGGVIAYRAADGQVVWRQETGARASAAPAVAAGRVYIALEDRRLLALNIENGQPIWTRRIGGAPNEILALDDRIYAGATDNFLYCVKADTGQIDWRWRTGADVIGQPVVDDRRVYFVSLDNMLRALDRKGGTQQWKHGLPFRPRTGPVLINDTLVVAGLSPVLRGFSARTGAPTGDLTLESDPIGPIHVVPGDSGPLVIAVITDILKGAIVLAFTHEIEPKVLPIEPLPNPTTP